MSTGAVVVDTNILFSALLREESKFARLLLSSAHTFYICESTIVELFKHKERLVQLSQLSETDVIRLFYLLLRSLTIVKEDLIPREVRQQAYQFCKDVDVSDSPQVALAIHLNARLWTGDLRLRKKLSDQDFAQFFDPD